MLLGENLYPYPYPYPPIPFNKKLIGFGSFEKVNLKLAGGVRTSGPPRPATPLKNIAKHSTVDELNFDELNDRARIDERGGGGLTP